MEGNLSGNFMCCVQLTVSNCCVQEEELALEAKWPVSHERLWQGERDAKYDMP